MTSQTWHANGELLGAYVGGSLAGWEAASVEQHLGACADCRSAVAPLVDAGALRLAWEGVRSEVERPAQPAVVRLARRLGLSEPASVLLTASAAMRTAWLTSSVVALGFAFAASRFSGGERLWPFLLIAPLIPVLGVAASYGPATDPLEGLIVTSPYGRVRLILLRTLAVLAISLPMAMPLGLFLPGPTWVAAAWLGPALTMIPVLLALAAYTGPRAAAGVIAIAWSGVVLGSTRRLPATWPVDAERQLLFLALALCALLVLMLRSLRTRQIGAAL